MQESERDIERQEQQDPGIGLGQPAQPQQALSEITSLMPTGPSVFPEAAELATGLEKAIDEIQTVRLGIDEFYHFWGIPEIGLSAIEAVNIIVHWNTHWTEMKFQNEEAVAGSESSSDWHSDDAHQDDTTRILNGIFAHTENILILWMLILGIMESVKRCSPGFFTHGLIEKLFKYSGRIEGVIGLALLLIGAMNLRNSEKFCHSCDAGINDFFTLDFWVDWLPVITAAFVTLVFFVAEGGLRLRASVWREGGAFRNFVGDCFATPCLHMHLPTRPNLPQNSLDQLMILFDTQYSGLPRIDARAALLDNPESGLSHSGANTQNDRVVKKTLREWINERAFQTTGHADLAPRTYYKLHELLNLLIYFKEAVDRQNTEKMASEARVLKSVSAKLAAASDSGPKILMLSSALSSCCPASRASATSASSSSSSASAASASSSSSRASAAGVSSSGVSSSSLAESLPLRPPSLTSPRVMISRKDDAKRAESVSKFICPCL